MHLHQRQQVMHRTMNIRDTSVFCKGPKTRNRLLESLDAPFARDRLAQFFVMHFAASGVSVAGRPSNCASSTLVS